MLLKQLVSVVFKQTGNSVFVGDYFQWRIDLRLVLAEYFGRKDGVCGIELEMCS